MEQIKKFLHGKGFALVLAACLLAAAAAGVWAVRTVRDELRQNLTDLTNPSSTARQTIPEPEPDPDGSYFCRECRFYCKLKSGKSDSF